MEQNINNTQTENRKEQEIDLLELVGKLWRKKKQICKAAGYGALIGLVVAFSLPREYTRCIERIAFPGNHGIDAVCAGAVLHAGETGKE